MGAWKSVWGFYKRNRDKGLAEASQRFTRGSFWETDETAMSHGSGVTPVGTPLSSVRLRRAVYTLDCRIALKKRRGVQRQTFFMGKAR